MIGVKKYFILSLRLSDSDVIPIHFYWVYYCVQLSISHPPVMSCDSLHMKSHLLWLFAIDYKADIAVAITYVLKLNEITNALCSVSSNVGSFLKELFRRSNFPWLVAFLNWHSKKSFFICFKEVVPTWTRMILNCLHQLK